VGILKPNKHRDQCRLTDIAPSQTTACKKLFNWLFFVCHFCPSIKVPHSCNSWTHSYTLHKIRLH